MHADEWDDVEEDEEAEDEHDDDPDDLLGFISKKLVLFVSFVW